ncbi:MAG: hypothetical protein R3D59_12325 [Paracoccaceae bacterium]
MSATGVLTVTVHDDAPQDFTAQPMLFSNEGSATGSGALNFYESIGADGGTAVFSGITDGETLLLTDGTAVTSGGAPVQLYGDGTDVLVGRVDNGDGTFTDVFRSRSTRTARWKPTTPIRSNSSGHWMTGRRGLLPTCNSKEPTSTTACCRTPWGRTMTSCSRLPPATARRTGTGRSTP